MKPFEEAFMSAKDEREKKSSAVSDKTGPSGAYFGISYLAEIERCELFYKTDVRQAARFIDDLSHLIGDDGFSGSAPRITRATHGVIELLSVIYDKDFRQVDADVCKVMNERNYPWIR